MSNKSLKNLYFYLLLVSSNVKLKPVDIRGEKKKVEITVFRL
jgi:hypothetical protein